MKQRIRGNQLFRELEKKLIGRKDSLCKGPEMVRAF